MPVFLRIGAQYFPKAVSDQDLRLLERAFACLPPDQAGIRLHGIEELSAFLSPAGPIGTIAARLLSNECQAVRAILFDKTAATNWALPWHQDRTIAVIERVDVDGFGPWTMKHGIQHVAPPDRLLSRMVTLRLHFDIVTPSNAPLRIAPGSHRFGRIPEGEIDDVVRRCGSMDCFADRGDIWAYKTPILHASDRARSPGRRRVLQVDYSTDSLPGGLAWLGV